MWDLSCPDWEQRLMRGQTLVPDLPNINAYEGERAVRIFDKLRLADVPGTPTMGEAGGEWFRSIVRGLFGSLDPVTRERMIRELFLLVPKKNSKAVSLDTALATPSGFTTMREIAVGDLVLDSNGRPAPVLCKSEVFVDRDCFEVEFSTGERVTCDAEHLWVTDAHADRDRQPDRRRPCPTVRTTREIAATLIVGSGQYRINNHRTALAGALELPPTPLPIPPYVLGAWLGDGAAEGAVITAGAADAPQMMESIRSHGHSVEMKGFDPRTGAARLSISEQPGNGPLPYRFRTEAIKLDVLGNKHIPQIYLRGSFEQRLELLRGLMDTDGSMSAAGQACFTTTRAALRDGVVELVNSLGLKASASEHRAMLKGKDCGPYWLIQFWPFDEIVVFNMPRKMARQRPCGATNASRSRTRQIVACRPVPSVPTQCIGVGSETSQFLVTRSLIPTHNTTNGALLMLTALLLNSRPNAPFILTAPVQDVAELAFAAVRGAIDLDEVLKKKLHVRDHLKMVIHRETKAELQIMTFDPSVLTGQKCAGVLIDELHVVAKMSKAASAIRQLRGGMLPFPEAFLAFITTQSEEPPSGVFRAELIKARQIRDGKQEGAMLPVLYEFPEKLQQQRDAWRDPKIWHWVTPNAGRSISIPRLIQEMNTAENTSEEELRAWASQHLNIQIGLAIRSGGWAGADYWEPQARADITLEIILTECEVVCVGIDGGGLDDLLGLAVGGRHKTTREWLVWTHAWAHQIVLKRRKEEAPRFLDFAADGDLTIVEQMGDDFKAVAAIVARVEQAELLDKCGVDPAGIGGIMDALAEAKVPEDKIIGISQGWKMTGVIKTTERKLAEGVLWHADQPMMNWCVGNAKVVPLGNAITITKAAAGSAKIDPLMAVFDAVSLLSLNPPVPPKKRKLQVYTVG